MEHRAHERNHLYSLPQAHVITQHSTAATGVVLIEKPHPLLLVVPQVLVDRGWDLKKIILLTKVLHFITPQPSKTMELHVGSVSAQAF